MLGCAVLTTGIKTSSHIDDTTRHDSMRHDPFFRSPYNQMDQMISSHICSTTKSGRHNKKLRQQKSVCKRFWSFLFFVNNLPIINLISQKFVYRQTEFCQISCLYPDLNYS